jgi:Zn-dependent oligopeptidase
VDSIVSTKNPTFDSTVKRYALQEGEDESILSSIVFANYVSTDPAVRMASAEATAKLQSWSIETQAREDFYKAFEWAEENTKKKSISAVDNRLMEKYLLDFKRNGLALDESSRNKLKELRKSN